MRYLRKNCLSIWIIDDKNLLLTAVKCMALSHERGRCAMGSLNYGVLIASALAMNLRSARRDAANPGAAISQQAFGLRSD